MAFFKENKAGNYSTSARNILAAKAFFKANPSGRIDVGMWDRPNGWNKAEFDSYLLDCLNAKINRSDNRTGRKLTKEYQSALLSDGRKVREYQQKRIRHTGCRGHLSTREMQAHFPHINNQPREE